MDIRLLTETDAEQFWRFRLLALESEPRAFASSPQEHRAMSLEQTGERLRPVPDGAFVVGALDNETLVGTAGFYRDARPKIRHKGMIWGVYVAASHRGRGIGSAILGTLIDRVRTYSGMRQVQLAVGATQTAAERMYRALGFETFGLERDAINTGEEFVDEFWMVLRL